MSELQRKRIIPNWVWLLVVVAAALALRLTYVWQVAGTGLVSPDDLDPGFYYRWAKAIAAGDLIGKEPFVQSPLYAYLLGLFMTIFGTALTPILVAQSLLGAGTVLLTWQAGRRYLGETQGLLAAGFLAIYGPFLFFEGMVMKTFLSAFLTVLLAVLLERAARLSAPDQAAASAGTTEVAPGAAAGEPGIGTPPLAVETALAVESAPATGTPATMVSALAAPSGAPASAARPGAAMAFLLAGLVFGLLTLDRDNFIVLSPVLALLALRLGGGFNRRGLQAAALFTVATCAVIAPVTLRNWMVSRDFVLLTTGGGEVFFIGNNADANGLYVPPPFVRPDPQYEHADFRSRATEISGHPVTPMQSSWFWFAQGIDFIRTEPAAWARLEWRKFFHFWNWYELPDNLDYGVVQWFSPLLRALNVTAPPQGAPTLSLPGWALLVSVPGGTPWMQIRLHLFSTFGTLAPLAFLGLLVTWPKRRRLLPLHILLFGYMATVLLFFNFARFRVPAVPLLALFASEGLLVIGRALQRGWGLAVAFAGRAGDLPGRARTLVPGARGAAILGLFLASAAFVNVEYPRGVVPALEQALLVGNAYYAQNQPEAARQSYYTGLVLLGEGPAGAAGDELLKREFGPGITRDVLLKELEVESVARGPQYKGIHLGIHHGLGIALVQQAQGLIDQGKRMEAMPLLDRAIDQFNEALKIAPAYLLTHRKMARAYELRGDTPQAIDWLRKAVDLWPEDLQARLDLAELLFATGEPRDALRQMEAARHYNASIETDQLAQMYFNRGLVFLKGLDDPARALFDFDRALGLDPSHPQAAEIKRTIGDLKARGVSEIPDDAFERAGAAPPPGAAPPHAPGAAPGSPATPGAPAGADEAPPPGGSPAPAAAPSAATPPTSG